MIPEAPRTFLSTFSMGLKSVGDILHLHRSGTIQNKSSHKKDTQESLFSSDNLSGSPREEGDGDQPSSGYVLKALDASKQASEHFSLSLLSCLDYYTSLERKPRVKACMLPPLWCKFSTSRDTGSLCFPTA